MMTTFTKLLRLSAAQTLTVVRNLCQQYGEVIESPNNYIYIPNPGHPLVLLAHVDTVPIKAVEPKVRGTVITNKYNDPLGGDDRCGVWAILQIAEILRRSGLPVPSLLFTDGEESGGTGMRQFVKDEKFKKDGVRLLIALDRRGCNDWVDYITVPKEVKQYVERFGFIESHGSYSDVRDLSEDTLIPGVNLSVGYYHQHTAAECVHYDELDLTVRRVVKMCKDPIEDLYKVAKPKYTYGRYGGWGGHYSGNYGDGYGYDNYLPAKRQTTGNVIGYVGKDYTSSRHCCSLCGEYVIPADYNKKEGVCHDCYDKYMKDGVIEMDYEEITPDEAATWALQSVTDRNWCCGLCGTYYENCECGHIVEELDKELAGLPADKREAAWEHILSELLETDALYSAILKHLQQEPPVDEEPSAIN